MIGLCARACVNSVFLFQHLPWVETNIILLRHVFEK